MGIESSSAFADASSAVLDALELFCAPPVLCTTPVRRSCFTDESADGELSASVDDVDETVDNVDVEPDGEVDCGEPEEGLDGLLVSVDEDGDELDEPEDEELDDEPASGGSASATPGIVATADPTPSATANAPTRATYLT